MAGSGPAPKTERARRNTPTRGEWQTATEVGWQHGTPPQPPAEVGAAAKAAWETWFSSWFASFWGPETVPGLLVVIAIYDRVASGSSQLASELRLQMDAYGITPKGQASLRWRKPQEDPSQPKAQKRKSAYSHLKAVPDAVERT